MNSHGNVELEIHVFLTAVLDEGEWLSLGGSSPLCAITISQLIRWVSQNTTNLY